MERINSITSYTIAQWEQAIANRNDISFDEMKLHKGLVCGVSGTIAANNKRYSVKWLHDGRCFYQGKRARQYDIF